MVQNHILQLLALVAMEPPVRYEATAVRDEKVKVLRSLRSVGADESVTGQYRAGTVTGQSVPGYDEELGKDSGTETFVAIKAHIDNWRWKGVPFYLRTGKRLPKRTTEIVVQFRPVPHSIFSGRGARTVPNRLVIGIQPSEDIQLTLMAKVPGLDRDGLRLRPVPLGTATPDRLRAAAARSGRGRPDAVRAPRRSGGAMAVDRCDPCRLAGTGHGAQDLYCWKLGAVRRHRACRA
jgi:glucose-6-phosphate 1-dehydrogenase